MISRKTKINYALVVAYMLIIFYLSSIPLELPEIINKFDPRKIFLHIAEYSILGLLLFNATKKSWFSFPIGSLYGLSDETHQYFVPSRVADPFDVAVDIIGVFLGILFFKYVWGKLTSNIEIVNKSNLIEKNKVE
jgi:VanZ family protein